MTTDQDKQNADGMARAFAKANRFTIATNGHHEAEMNAFEDDYLQACSDKNVEHRNSMLALLNWLSHANSPYGILYGEKERFCTNEKDLTTEELLTEFFKQYVK